MKRDMGDLDDWFLAVLWHMTWLAVVLGVLSLAAVVVVKAWS